MGLSREARTVRDPAAGMGQRVQALCRCVERYSPIGFQATLEFLEAKAGPYRSSGEALGRALDMLETARALWRVELAQYAVMRREEKRRGRRQPNSSVANPNRPRYWHGLEREAAMFAVTRWQARMADDHARPAKGVERDLWDLVESLKTSRGLDEDARTRLDATITLLDDQLRRADYMKDPSSYIRDNRFLWLAQQVRVAAGS